MRTSRVTSSLGLLVLLAAAAALAQTSKVLTIYVIDVEGGNSQLYVTPSGESVLIDTGNAGAAAVRDAERILAAVKDAGLSRIDHLITTHFHADHVGGVVEVASRIPIAEFIDHGANVQRDPLVDAFLHETYPLLYRTAKHTVAVPGNTIPVGDVDGRRVEHGAVEREPGRGPRPGVRDRGDESQRRGGDHRAPEHDGGRRQRQPHAEQSGKAEQRDREVQRGQGVSGSHRRADCPTRCATLSPLVGPASAGRFPSLPARRPQCRPPAPTRRSSPTC